MICLSFFGVGLLRTFFPPRGDRLGTDPWSLTYGPSVPPLDRIWTFLYIITALAICLTTVLFAFIAFTLLRLALILTYVSSYCKSNTNHSRGPPPGMATKRKNNPFSSKGPQQHLKMSHVPDQQDALASDRRYLHNDYASMRRGIHRASMDHRTYLNPMEVQQWAANSATGPDLGDEYYPPQSGASLGDDLSSNVSTAGPLLSGSTSASHPVISHVSLQYAQGISDPEGPGLSFDPCTASADYSQSGAETCLGLSDVTNFHSGVGHAGLYYGDDQSYPTPASADMVYSCSSGFHSDIPRNYEDPSFPSDWASVQGEHLHGWSGQPSSHAMPLSPVSPGVMEASVSSQGSFHAAHSSSPRSSATQEDNEDCVFIPQFRNGDVVHFTSTQETMDAQVDLTSTLKPTRGCQRPPLTNLALWPHVEAATDYYMAGSSVDISFQRRSSGETELATAREHALYQVGPHNDGLYHCPFEGDDGCTHKAEKLKCNYDKHLDSHLKPYRCKVHSCSAVPFSSTACLLRHEREAHGMHGHGEKPHQCWYEDCDRSIPGQGFPRRWNLYDHMKRVHNYTGPPSSNESSSPTPSSASSHYRDASTLALKKRRTSSSSQAQAPKRPKPTAVSKAQVKNSKGLSSQAKQQQSMQNQWHEQHAALQERLARLDPNDTLGMEQIGADYAILHTISLNIRRLEAGQLANE